MSDPRAALLEERNALLRRLGRPERPDAPARDSTADAIDVAVIGEADELLARHRALLLDRLAEIDLALGRVTAGTFGACEDCGAPIPPARLHAVPEAATCVRCQTERERAAAAGEPEPFGVPRVHRPTAKPLEELG